MTLEQAQSNRAPTKVPSEPGVHARETLRQQGAVFQASVAGGEELRAREAIVTQGGPGGAFTTRIADTVRSAAAIHADASCIYWIETDTSDPAPGAETIVVRSVKR
jgi:hypothetical protein